MPRVGSGLLASGQFASRVAPGAVLQFVVSLAPLSEVLLLASARLDVPPVPLDVLLEDAEPELLVSRPWLPMPEHPPMPQRTNAATRLVTDCLFISPPLRL